MRLNSNAIWLILGGLLAVLLVLRSIERRQEAPPPPMPVARTQPPASAMAPAAPVVAHNAMNPPPHPSTMSAFVPLPPMPLQSTTSGPPISQSTTPIVMSLLEQELEGYAKEAAHYWPPPQRSALITACQADPRGTEKSSGIPFLGQSAVDTYRTTVQQALCKADLSKCSDIPTRPQCHDSTCQDILQFDGGELIQATPDGCGAWVAELLWVKSVMDGSPNESECESMLKAYPKYSLTGSFLPQACAALASDYATGGNTFCEVHRAAYNSPNPNDVYRGGCPDYADVEVFAKGEEVCNGLPDWRRGPNLGPSCRMLARLKKAAQLKDPASCKGEPACLMAMGDDVACTPTYSERVKQACVNYAGLVQLRWMQSSMNAQSTLDGLLQVQVRLEGDQSRDGSRLRARAQKLTEDVRSALAEMAKHRQSKYTVITGGGPTQ